MLMVGHLLEYHPVVEELRQIIAAGELGDIYYIYTQRVNLGRIRGDENALWSFAPHDISQILYILGIDDPVDVSARGQSFIQGGIEDVVFLSLFFGNRIMAHIHLSWLDPHKTRTTTIVGSKQWRYLTMPPPRRSYASTTVALRRNRRVAMAKPSRLGLAISASPGLYRRAAEDRMPTLSRLCESIA